MAVPLLDVPALGRPFRLGMLYDARSEVLIPGITLWDPINLQENHESKEYRETNYKIIAGDTIETKASLLDIKGGIKASFMSGMIEVGGSAKYLNDKKSSHHQSRVSLSYNCSLRYDQLTMAHMEENNVNYPDVFLKVDATHVVTAIRYGAQSIFVFDSKTRDMETKSQIEAELHGMVKKLPRFAGEGKASISMSDRDRSMAKQFTCTFYGDFQPPYTPASYEDALNLYRDIPKLLGENRDHCVPQQVWLYPLTKLDKRASSLMKQIGNPLVIQTEKYLEQLQDLNMRCSDIIILEVCQHLHGTKSLLLDFQAKLRDYRRILERKLCEVLPQIRGGDLPEKALEDLLHQHEKSPFQICELQKWLEEKEDIVLGIAGYYKNMKDIKGTKYDSDPVQFARQKDIWALLANPDVLYVVCFQFTTPSLDPYLKSLDDFIKNPKLLSRYKMLGSFIGSETRKKVQSFCDFATANINAKETKFVILETQKDNENQGAAIRIFEDGQLQDKEYEPPSKLDPPKLSSLQSDVAEIQWRKPEIGASLVTQYEVSYLLAGKQRSLTVEASKYSVKLVAESAKVRALCNAGKGLYSDTLTCT